MAFRSDDPLYLHDDVVTDLNLYRELFKTAHVKFDDCGINKITLDDRNAFVKRGGVVGGEILEFIEELRPWAEENFQNNEVFTILGIWVI